MTLTKQKIDKGFSKIDNVISKFTSMIDELPEGITYLISCKDENAVKINDLVNENNKIDLRMILANKVKRQIEQIAGLEK